MNKNKRIIGKTLEELLKELREKNNWSYLEVMEHLNDKNVTDKQIKKWEYGLEYPDLDMIYKLSELYMIPSEEFVQAKNNSFELGSNSINIYLIKRICYILNVSFYVGVTLEVIAYALILIYSLLYFIACCKMVTG